MIKVISKSYVESGEIEKYKDLASELIEKSKKEESNISYGLYQDIDNHQVFTFIEEWKDKDSLYKHMKTDHFMKIVPKLAALREKDADMNIYTKCL